MKTFFNLLNNTKIRILLLIVISISGILIFQAQQMSTTYVKDNPNIDQVPYDVRVYYTIHPPVPKQPLIITTPDGYDNFDQGFDFAESYLSVNPLNPIQAYHEFNTNGGHYTMNGLDWTFVSPPVPNTAGDPWTAYDSLGNLFYECLNGSVSASWVIKSTNNGQSWGSAVQSCTGVDRETMSIDQSTGPYAGYIYCGETSGSGASFYRSTDHGASFQSMATLSPHNLPGFMTAPGPGPTGISGGAVYAVGSSGSAFTPTYTFWRSTDGGVTMTLMSTQNGWVNTVGTQSGGRNSVNNMRVRPYPFIYADNSFGPYRGRFYVFYCANNPPGNGNKPDVYCRYSTDGCATFSSPTTVNDDANSQNNHQWQEAAWVDKTTGKVYVHWMDTRNTPTSDSAEIWASYSTNGGVSFVTNQKISNAKMIINCSTCPGGGTPRYQGDYNGMGSNPTTSFLSWSDYRSGNFGSFSAYFPDFAMLIRPSPVSVNASNDSTTTYVTIPSVKLYTDKVKFTAPTISPTPGSGSVTFIYRNRTTGAAQDSLTTYPDSLKLVVKTTGGVTSGTYTVTLQGKGSNGTPIHQRTFSLFVNPLGISNINTEIPDKFYLFQNFPNPFNPATLIRFDLAKAGSVKLNVYDITGRLVENLINTNYVAGKYDISFDGSKLASGIYFYKLETPSYTGIRKMVLIK